jgi:hypothetical protein
MEHTTQPIGWHMTGPPGRSEDKSTLSIKDSDGPDSFVNGKLLGTGAADREPRSR